MSEPTGLPEGKPNILFVFSDQHRWSDLGCYGNREVLSPNLDGFAAGAVRFNHGISNAPLCVPMRGTMMTGRFPLRHRAITNDLPIRDDGTSIAHALNAAGYHTAYIGKWHLAGVPRDRFVPPDDRLGFAEWKVCNCNHNYMQAWYDDEENLRHEIAGYEPIGQTDLAVDFIRRNVARRWALTLSWGPPHDPYQLVPQRYLRMYAERDLPLRPNVPAVITDTQHRRLSRADIRRNLQGYYAHITALDEQFGRLIAALESTNQLDRTIVVYTSDHGDMLGSHGYTNKQLPYDESIRVPFLVSWKGNTHVGVSNELIGLVDLPVSLMALAGVSFPPDVDGHDLHTLFLDPGASGPDAVYLFDYVPCHQAADRGGREWRGIRTGRYTFARTATDDGCLLVDNERDPFQMENLVHAPDHRKLKRDLSRMLDAYVSRHDKLLPWETFIREYGFTDEWNHSQKYFGRPVLQ